MKGTDQTDFGGAMLWARILDLGKERDRRPRKRAERLPMPRHSPIVYIFSGFRRRWLRTEGLSSRPVSLLTEKP